MTTTRSRPGAPGGALDEALERLHRTGPEFDGWLSNHGPMVVEAMARRGAGAAVHRWTDGYARRLEDRPGPGRPIADDAWRAALGDPARLGDWLEHFRRTVREQPWEQVLRTWWPRLLPGIAAGATHGVIRTGHAVEALRADVTAPRLDELGQALGYWAARWQPVPGLDGVDLARPLGSERGRTASREQRVDAAVEAVPRVPRQDGGIRDRLAQLPGLPGWPTAGDLAAAAPDAAPPFSAAVPPGSTADAPGSTADAPGSTADAAAVLADVVAAVVRAYPRIAVGQPTMLVHAATAPNAVLRVLPSLPPQEHAVAVRTAWAATAAVLAAYAPAPADRQPLDVAAPADPWELALAHGGEHVLKLADTALDVEALVGPGTVAAAVATAVALDA
ncbi:questin oxidase family protein [Kineosporia sp. R_H_3]|uniref:questin oxidase family protein n=1 Tax=Kineosporia sp. R_H_3 TaxID=1961848 RepID=UPI000B4B934A|nr:questin oxidase family protein [Kineosporia sp. R_H_3]